MERDLARGAIQPRLKILAPYFQTVVTRMDTPEHGETHDLSSLTKGLPSLIMV